MCFAIQRDNSSLVARSKLLFYNGQYYRKGKFIWNYETDFPEKTFIHNQHRLGKLFFSFLFQVDIPMMKQWKSCFFYTETMIQKTVVTPTRRTDWYQTQCFLYETKWNFMLKQKVLCFLSKLKVTSCDNVNCWLNVGCSIQYFNKITSWFTYFLCIISKPYSFTI